MTTPADSLARSVLEWWGLLLGWESFALNDLTERFNLACERAEFGPESELWPFAFEAMTGLVFQDGPITADVAIEYIETWLAKLTVEFPPGRVHIRWRLGNYPQSFEAGEELLLWEFDPNWHAFEPDWGTTLAEVTDYLLNTWTPPWHTVAQPFIPDWGRGQYARLDIWGTSNYVIVSVTNGYAYGWQTPSRSRYFYRYSPDIYELLNGSGKWWLYWVYTDTNLIIGPDGNRLALELDRFTNLFHSSVLAHCQTQGQERLAPPIALTERALNGNVFRLFGAGVWTDLNATFERTG